MNLYDYEDFCTLSNLAGRHVVQLARPHEVHAPVHHCFAHLALVAILLFLSTEASHTPANAWPEKRWQGITICYIKVYYDIG